MDSPKAIKRVQSASSINTFKQCPRKYFYQYVLALPIVENIYQIRGNIAHDALEHFFQININHINEKNFEKELKIAMQELLIFHWRKEKERLDKLKLEPAKIKFYFEETLHMLIGWVDLFCKKIKTTKKSFKDAFEFLTPIAEQYFISNKYGVQGYMDAIEIQEGHTRIMDYKTSSKNELTDEYLLQLAIYVLLYEEKYKKFPDEVGLYLLKHGEKSIKADENLLKLAKKEILAVHERTQSEEIEDYPKKEGPLCKWSSGKCDFYDICFGQKKVKDF
ncbi:PD-(D/E)XK nuclease family protein [Candidatus Woesearchaeota archaeon]|nr:PD-(D/E)XK nuclease family protein [Candidatus Woesearchaeota archaeon]